MRYDNMRLAVPYYSQFIDIHDEYWMLRACGAASFKMVAEYYGVPSIDMVDFCNSAKENGGYDIQNGWVHEYLLTKARELGLQGSREEKMTSIEHIFSSLEKGEPVIASVEKRLLEQKRFHMIVIVGYEEGKIIYHEPESTDKEKGQYRECDMETFMSYWRGMAIFITK